jgi:hypothetical protein
LDHIELGGATFAQVSRDFGARVGARAAPPTYVFFNIVCIASAQVGTGVSTSSEFRKDAGRTSFEYGHSSPDSDSPRKTLQTAGLGSDVVTRTTEIKLITPQAYFPPLGNTRLWEGPAGMVPTFPLDRPVNAREACVQGANKHESERVLAREWLQKQGNCGCGGRWRRLVLMIEMNEMNEANEGKGGGCRAKGRGAPAGKLWLRR